MELVAQKLLNWDFSGWSSSGRCYNWDDNDTGSVTGFTAYNVSGLQIASGSGTLYSAFIPVSNVAGDVYTLTGIMEYLNAAAVSGLFTIREYDEDLTSLGDTNWNVALTSSLATSTFTLGADVGNDLQLNSSTTGIQVLINQADISNYTWHINSLQMLGKDCTLTYTDVNLPMDQSENLLQKHGYSASGKILSGDSYGSPLKEITFTIDGTRKEDYDSIYAFLTHDDILFTNGTFNYTDALSNTYFGKFVQVDTQITGNGYYNCSMQLQFKEIR